MQIIIKSTNMDLTPAIKEYVNDKIGSLEKYLKNTNPDLVKAEVEVGKIKKGQRQGEICRAEVNLSIGGKLIRVSETEESLYAAIDLVKDELKREVRQFKDKTQTQYIRGARSWKKFWRLSSLARFRKPKSKKIIKRK